MTITSQTTSVVKFASSAMGLSVSEVNSMGAEEFAWVFRNVVELCPAAAASASRLRPFAGAADLCAAFDKYLDELSAGGGSTFTCSVYLFFILALMK